MHYQKQIDELQKVLDRISAKSKAEKRAYTADEQRDREAILADIAELRSCVGIGPVTGPRIEGQTEHASFNDEPPRTIPTGRTYRKMFGQGQPLSNGGFRDFNEFLTVLSSKRYDSRLFETRTMGITTPSDGGFSVPEEFAAWLLDASLESEVVRPRATVWPMKSETLKVPGWDSATHTSTLFGGLTGTWVSELGSNTEVFAKMRQIELNAKKLACYTAASNELVQDGIDFDKQISLAMIKTIGWYLDYAFLQGTGAGQPQGVLANPALVTVAKETGQAAATILYENVTKMYSRLAPQCMGNAVWVASQTAIPQLLTMTIQVGMGGSVVPAVLQQNGKFTLLGKEMIFSEKVPALGTVGDLLLCDFSQYIIGLRKEVSLDKSIHVGWSTDTSSYRTIVRADGQGSWDKAITPKSGSTLSWAVALATRS